MGYIARSQRLDPRTWARRTAGHVQAQDYRMHWASDRRNTLQPVRFTRGIRTAIPESLRRPRKFLPRKNTRNTKRKSCVCVPASVVSVLSVASSSSLSSWPSVEPCPDQIPQKRTKETKGTRMKPRNTSAFVSLCLCCLIPRIDRRTTKSRSNQEPGEGRTTRFLNRRKQRALMPLERG